MGFFKNLFNGLKKTKETLSKKLSKLDAKLDRLKVERKNKFTDKKKAYQKLAKIREEIANVEETSEIRETKQYDFIEYLVMHEKNIPYVGVKRSENIFEMKDCEVLCEDCPNYKNA